MLANYADLDIPALVTSRGADLTPIQQLLDGKTTVFVGHSGVGKSTLVNALVPGRGPLAPAWSATSARAGTPPPRCSRWRCREPWHGWVIDTPGVRSFGLAHVSAQDLLWAFPDLEDGAVQCPRGCEHLAASEGCQLDAWVAAGHSQPGPAGRRSAGCCVSRNDLG